MNCLSKRLKTNYFLLLLISIYIFLPGCSKSNAKIEVKVADFGALPDDGQDDTRAILALLKNIKGKKNIIISFEMGSYDIYGLEKSERGNFKPSIEVLDMEGLTIDGRGAELTGHDLASMFHFVNCKNITLTNLTTDWNPLPYTQGKVVKVDTAFVDLEVVAPFTAQAGRRTEAILGYDMDNRRMARRFTDHYQKGYEKPSEIVKPGVMRIFISRQDRFAGKLPSVGDYLIARHQVYGYQSFQFSGCSDIHVENVNIYCNPGMGLTARDSRDIFVSHLKVMLRPGSGRWMSCTADATNFQGCRGIIVMENCLFEGQGDDATNVRSGEYLLVDDRLNDRKLKIKHGYKYTSGIPESPETGDIIEISSPGKPLVPYTTAVIKSVEVNKEENTLVYEFSENLPAQTGKGDIVANASSCPVLRIKNCTAIRNRARGFIIKTRDVIIENCTMQDITASGVGLEADINAWWEAIGSGNVIIRNNRFINCKFEGEYLQGVIESHTMSKTIPPGVHKDITIENNIFIGSDGNIIKLGSAQNVKILNNIMDGPKNEAILLYNTKDVLISGNKLTNAKTGLVMGDGCDASTIKMENNIGF